MSLASKQLKQELSRRRLIDFTEYTMGTYVPNWHHRVIAKALERVSRFETRRLLVVAPPRSGKAMALDTPIYTPSGWTTIGDLQVGDQVYGSTGEPVTVIAKSRVFHDRKCYKVSTSDSAPGEEIIADAEHEWTVRLCRKAKAWKTYTTQYLANRASKRNPAVFEQVAIDHPRADLPLDPYCLGLWIGDGCSYDGTMSAADEDAAFYRAELARVGIKTSDRATPQTFGIIGIVGKLRDLEVLRNKHIPEIYLRASREQRLALLQGLIDTDGHVCAKSGQIEFYCKPRMLADQVLELVRSLGVKASLGFKNTREYGIHHRVRFFLEGAARLPRKAIRARDAKKHLLRFLLFEEVENHDTVCIQVDAPDSLFLAGRAMIPTHNSQLISKHLPAWLLGLDPALKIIAGTYAQDLSDEMARSVKRIINSASYADVFPGTQIGGMDRVQEFHTTEGGVYKATSVGGAITGRGANILILDDLIKSRKEAESQSIRDFTWEWLQDDAMSRLEWPNAVVLMFTRWHHDDPIGRILALERDQWEVIHLPAIAEPQDESPGYDPREEGDPLWPGRFQSADERRTGAVSSEELRGRALLFFEDKRQKNPYGFESLYQGRPSLRTGGMFQRAWMQTYVGFPETYYGLADEVLISVDATFGKSRRADKVGIVVAARQGTNIFVLDEVNRRMDFPETRRVIKDLQAKWPSAGVLIETKANGQALIDTLSQEIPRVMGFDPRDSKEARAQLAAHRFEAGQVWLPRAEHAPWVAEWVEDFVGFPSRQFDDRVDAFTQLCIRWDQRHNARQRLLRIVTA